MAEYRNFYTVRDLKAEGICGPTKTYELIAQGKLQMVKLGRKTLIKGESVRNLLEAA